MIGLESYKGAAVASTFLSQILFFITATYLDDFYSESIKELQTNEPLLSELEFVRSSSKAARMSIGGRRTPRAMMVEEDSEEDEAIKTEERFERVRYSIQFMIYKMMDYWKWIDCLALNFHLITSTVTVILCAYWQVSLFTCFYLLCTVVLIIKSTQHLYSNGQNLQESRKEIDIETAHQINKEYMQQAGNTLLQVRRNQWPYQYWAVILSMIIMYPTPILSDLQKIFTDYKT